MDQSYEIFKTELRFRSRNKLYCICINITAFFQNKIVINCFKTENFHPCICVYSHMMAKQWSTS